MVDDLDRMAEALETGEAGPSGVLISRQTSTTSVPEWMEGAWNFVEGSPGWELLLPRLLAGICIVDTWEEARNLHQLRPEATVICRDGRMISSRGWQRRGRARPSRPGRHELESAHSVLKRAEATVQEATGIVRQAKERIQEVRSELERARSNEQSTSQKRDEARREHDRCDALVRGLSSETGRRRAEIVRLEQEIVVHQRTASEKSSEAEKHLSVEEGLEDEATQADDSRRQAEAEEARLSDLLTERRVERATQQQRKDLCVSQLQPAEVRRKELTDLVVKRREEITADTVRMDSARTEAQSSTEAQMAAGQKARDIEASTSGLKAARDNETALLMQKEEEVVMWRQEAVKSKDLLASMALKKSQLDHQRQNLADRLQREYATGLMDAKIEGEDIPQSEEDWVKLQEEAKGLREKMEDMGPVNTEAISEYEELEGRLKFLETEEKDLTTAKAQLEEAIKKINQTTRLLFEETFDKVRVSFGTLFAELFGGGRATVKMTEGDDSLDGGIDIEAQPPGKQPKNITQLSGGEKAMTALALLLAIYSVKPSPFCVLDEMDAPLDESNTVRFVQIIERFVERSQFLVITHNKRTMSAADLLYGVTAAEPGVSRMMSVKLTHEDETPLFAQAAA
jgi:chromosome segregation protein